MKCALFLFCAMSVAAQEWTVFQPPAETTREQLARRLNAIGQQYLERRRAAVAGIRSRDEAERRQKEVREKILRLVGGLPEYRGPLNTKHLGTVDRGDYRFEKIIYESLPGFYVPANVYVPAKGTGPFPAVLMPVGHSVEGKEGERQTAIDLARKGFVVLKYDPVGQGERLQYYDPDLRASKVGGPTAEHTHANGHTVLIGDNVARYRIWDGMRGIDYLLTRKDVDANRIGCTGCSGGGTLTTYISALDPRVKAAAPACYITSWEELLDKLGPQDGEQTFPYFLSEGLNIADFVELFAPKPWLIASTIQDFFPLEGARQTYEEAKRFYGLFGAGDRIRWFIGPGPHGVPLPTREAVNSFFIQWLEKGQGDPHEAPIELDPPDNLLCTKTGQVSDSLGGETVFTLNRKRAGELMPAKAAIASAADVDRLRTRLGEEIRSAAAIGVTPGSPPAALQVHRRIERDGYTLNLISYEVERGVHVTGLLLVPDGAGPKPAALVVDSRPKQAAGAPGGDLERLAQSGILVLAIQPRGVPEAAPARGGSDLLGDVSLAFRAFVVGRTLTGMRAEDVIRGVDYLCSRDDVDRARLTAVGEGAGGVYALHAAVLDHRIRKLVLEQSLATYRLAVERPIHRHIYDVAIPGVLKKYDLDDLLVALSPRAVAVLDPVDALGRPLRLAEFRDECGYVFDSDAKLGQAGRVEVAYRTRREPLSSFVRIRN